jgi:hypothetical protein
MIERQAERREEVIPIDDSAVTDPLIRRLLPAADPLTDFFWSSGQDGRLRLLRCGSCGYYSHPPSARCPRCLGDQMAAEPVSGRGLVASFTVNHQQWTPGQPPYVIALVEIDEQPGLRLTTNIIGCEPDEVRIGMPVQVVFLERSGYWYPLFRPMARP